MRDSQSERKLVRDSGKLVSYSGKLVADSAKLLASSVKRSRAGSTIGETQECV